MKQVFSLLTILSFLLLASLPLMSQAVNYDESSIVLKTPTGDIFGTLTIPKDAKKSKLAIIIAGSGPTDRNGNNKYATNESLKLLAHELANAKIASIRYDKRGIADSQAAGAVEAELRFEDYVNDVKAWVDMMKLDPRFKEIIIIGHSEGSLIGMLAAEKVQGYISIAGPGRPADEVLKEQLSSVPEDMKKVAFLCLDTLKMGKTITIKDTRLYSIFRPSVQPYMISWIKYNPALEIAKLKIPILILNGTNDIQVGVEDAKKLSAASPKAKLVLIENMNHIFRKVQGDRQANFATYNNASLPIDQDFIKAVTSFIKKI